MKFTPRIPIMVIVGALAARGVVASGAEPTPAASQPAATPQASSAAASVRASIAASTIKTSDRAILTIEIDSPKAWKPDAISLEGALPEGWNVLTTRPAKAIATPTGERSILVYELEPFLPGKAEIKPLTIIVRPAPRPITAASNATTKASTPAPSDTPAPAPAPAPDATPITLTTLPISVEVLSVLPEGADHESLADIKGVVDPKTPTNWWLIGGVAAGTVAVISLAAWLVARQRRLALTRVVTRPAHEIALERLDALLAKKLLAGADNGLSPSERFKVFFDEASAILREYIEDRFHVRAPERTTEEFLRDARGSVALPENDVDALGRFLNQCDLVKFARHTPAPEEGDRAAGIVREFIVKTRAPEATVIIEGPGAVTARLAAVREIDAAAHAASHTDAVRKEAA